MRLWRPEGQRKKWGKLEIQQDPGKVNLKSGSDPWRIGLFVQTLSHTWFNNKNKGGGPTSCQKGTPRKLFRRSLRGKTLQLAVLFFINSIIHVSCGLVMALQKYIQANFISQSIMRYNKMLSSEEKGGRDLIVNRMDPNHCNEKKKKVH